MTLRTWCIFLTALLLFAICLRLLPHAPNFTPIAALAFVAIRYVSSTWAVLLPLSALFLSDLIIGFYSWPIMFSVYLGFGMIALTSLLVGRTRSLCATGAAVITGSLTFFLVTNAAVWLFTPWYEKTFAGLLYAYELGLPFLRNMLMGDLFYTFAIIAVVEVGLATHHLLTQPYDWQQGCILAHTKTAQR